MRIKKLSLFFIINLFLIPFSSCSSKNGTSFIVISDTHYLSKEYMNDPTRDYDEEPIATDGKTMQYNQVLFDKLLEKVIEDKPTYFIVTGDISYNGDYKSHLEITQKLKEVKEEGIMPLVIPGNHDTEIENPRSYSTKDYPVVKNTTIQEFVSLYQEFGYKDAIYRDDNSLSYIIETKNDEWLFMLDTTASRYNYEFSENFVYGKIFSLPWLEDKFLEAKEKGKKIITFSHHSIVSHNELYNTNFLIANYEKAQELFNKYNVKVNFSGHLHIQHIAQEKGIYDICSSSLLDYGNRYGKVTISHDKLSYKSHTIDFKMEDDSSFSEYSFALFNNMYINKKIKDDMSEEEKEELYLKALVNTYYFDGSTYLHKDLKKKKEYQEIISVPYFAEIDKSFSTNHHKLNISL
ncbi:MAG: metallophosphoesterase family protein [Bacilli bacterium]